MRTGYLISTTWLRLFVLCAVFLYAPGAAAGDLAQQSSQGGGVSVRVKPVDLSPGATTWSFQVALDTHSGDLGDDLAAIAVIVDPSGKQYRAVGWEGGAPGGHHRKGMLRFNAPSPRPHSIEVRIQRPGEAAARTFRWQLD